MPEQKMANRDEKGPVNDPSESLRLQEQIEQEARRSAYDQMFARHRKREKQSKPSATALGAPDLQTSDLFQQEVEPSLSQTPSEQTEVTGSAVRQEFPTIDGRASGKISGVYGIVHLPTKRYYVGSSVEIAERLRQHEYLLRKGNHHSAKLQQAWRGRSEEFRCVIIENVWDLSQLRICEQAWIDKLDAFKNGFNSKSVADGPEPSLETRIVSAINAHWHSMYAEMAPNRQDFPPNEADLQSYKAQRIKSLRSRLIAVLALVAVVGVSWYVPAIRFMWIVIPGLLAYIFWAERPESPEELASKRYDDAVENAKAQADDRFIVWLSEREGVEISEARRLFERAPKIVEERRKLSERFRRDPFLRARAAVRKKYKGELGSRRRW